MAVKEFVDKRLTDLLQKPPAVGGIEMRGTLIQQEPLKIEDKPKTLGSFKEHWRWETCRISLGNHGIYEAPGSAFWLSVAKPSWEGMHLPSTDITYGQVAAGRLLFSDEKFIRSAEEPAKRHYFINFAIPTAILSLTDVPNMEGQGFANLPCLGSRSVLAGLYTKFADAVRAMDLHKVRKLMESALTIPMRLRVAPSYKQVCLDSITYS